MRYRWLILGVVLAGGFNGCSCSNSGGGKFDLGNLGQDAFGSGNLAVLPAVQTVDLNAGGPAVTATFQAIAKTPQGDKDVTQMATWSLGDPTLGTIDAGVFTSGTQKGGT